MARLIGYMANRTDRLAAALHQERAVVTPRASVPPGAAGAKPVGWGLGFHQNGEVLHKKRPQLTGELHWETVAADVVSDCVVLHLRQPTVGDFHVRNTHPFRFGSWLFAHTGTIERFNAIEQRLRESLPDFLARNVRGSTDSELLFHVVLSFLHDAGQLDTPQPRKDAVLASIRSAVALVDRLCAEVKAPESQINLVLTEGRTMFALRRGGPMAYVERRGLHDPPETIPATEDPRAPTTLRYVMVVAEDVGDLGPHWVAMERGQTLVIDRDLSVRSA